ncbi:MAG TPA: tRNA uridine-5-carboxymethylaminomethyl(34) synthesis GTPase MnmE [Thermoanaerobaculia bacterium]|nr:tRNA uridine-5-carboxymethylaminomethyl(34) synthesis GTPase MnmE [Thermoanaerobaculia bacterium]
MKLDTIVAPATPPGRSALAIVRIDGPASNSILTSITKAVLPPVRHAAFVHIYKDADALDECIAIRYEAPHSFTGNDLVELTLHGNPLLVERVIATCVELGARIAEPGEFTERAVLNGKIDLVQAESIADLINARTVLQAKLSLSNLEGVLSRNAAAVRQTLLEVIARLEAALDFSEEGYEFITPEEARTRVAGALERLEAMAETYRRGRATTAGLSAVILGRPNAGKSTLLNRLVGSDRAIVTPIPGTTRDIVRETIEIGGLPVTLADTAGLRASDDVVEGIGIERARQAAAQADLVLYLVDGTVGLTTEDECELAGVDNVLLIYTKADLAGATTAPEALSISAVSDAGMTELLTRLDELVRNRFAAPEGALVNERQRLAVDEAILGMRAAMETLALGLDEQMVVVDLYRSANALGALTGAITRDDILDEIFSKFCIGK